MYRRPSIKTDADVVPPVITKTSRDQSLPPCDATNSILNNKFVEFAAYMAILTFVSAVWTETDAYRYTALLLLLAAIIYYAWIDYFLPDKPLIGLPGLFCIGWAAYVGARFAYDYTVYPERGLGTSEGIYLFPMAYATFGYSLWLFVRRPFILATAFVLASFLVTLYTLDVSSLLSLERANTALHNNPIHAASANGFIVLCMIPYIGYVLRRRDLSAPLRLALIAIAAVTFLVGLANICSLWSKGVWLALAVALPLQTLLINFTHGARKALIAMLVLVAVALVGAAMAWDSMWHVAGKTFEAAGILVEDASGEGVMPSVDEAINNEALPLSFRERLMLWTSAFLIWERSPVFGSGVSWEHFWNNRAYPEAHYNLLHNGYLEIAIRYGLLGLSFYAILYGWATRRVWQACKRGLIDIAAFQSYLPILVFFCGLIFSNSTIRLALGESYMMLAAGVGFYCYYALQKEGFVRPRTWF